MEEVRQLVAEEGREARNLVAFHVAVDIPVSARVSRKPPRSAGSISVQSLRRPGSREVPARLRSASTGRDKRAELQARYWALLFGNLQRAIGEIYTTVESHESLSECQEVILVLENYTRDFKSLCEWFRLKWDYDNTPPPQRPQSLAWEVRKTDFVRPESRKANSVKTSPSVSGKNSPLLSGHNTPSGKNSPSLSTGKISPAGSGKISPRISSSITSPKANAEFFGPKSPSSIKTHSKTDKPLKDLPSKLSDIIEKVVVESDKTISNQIDEKVESAKANLLIVQIGTAKEYPREVSPKQVVIKSSKVGKEIQEKNLVNIDKESDNKDIHTSKVVNTTKPECEHIANSDQTIVDPADESVVKKSSYNKTTAIVDTAHNKLSDFDSMGVKSGAAEELSEIKADTPTACENEQLPKEKENNQNAANSETEILKGEIGSQICTDHLEISKEAVEKAANKATSPKSSIEKKTENKLPSQESKHVKAPYSQAAAKPKIISIKPEVKTLPKIIALARSKTVVEIKHNKTNRQLSTKRTAKCSYPFNLTTGRPSVFDGTPNNRNNQKNSKITNNKPTATEKSKSNDTRMTQTKRPNTLKICESQYSTLENLAHENLKNSKQNSSTDTVATQIGRNESNDSLKTLVPDPDYQYFDELYAKSIEFLNIENQVSENDGWLTVKSRRLSRESKKHNKSHWANRFNQPSATTSLPTLNMIVSPKQEITLFVEDQAMNGRVKPKINHDSVKENEHNLNETKEAVPSVEIKKSEEAKLSQVTKEKEQTCNKPKSGRKSGNHKSLKVISSAIVRQKSDVTGLKTRSARNKSLTKFAKTDKKKAEAELPKDRLHSSLESLITSGLLRSQESTEGSFDFKQWKCEFMSSIDFLEDEDRLLKRSEFLKKADPVEMSEIDQMTCEIEENERKISLALDFQSDFDQRKLCEEEDLLNRQIKELQQVSDIDFDTETDDAETDAEILCEDSSHLDSVSCTLKTLGPLAASLEDQYEPVLAGLSWAERVDTLATLEALVARYPGRAQQLHAKLSQGIRRRGSLQETLKRYQLKQARAEHHRLELQSERTNKIHQLLARVEDVKAAKNFLIDEKRQRMEQRLQKAAENRDQHIKDIVRKAHDEEEKLREIAFIKQLEAEHRRQDFLEQCRSHTARLRQMRRDRLRKLEQKEARSAAVGARRQALEEARARRARSLVEKRRQRDARVEELQERTRQRRDCAARQKAADVKSRLTALAAAADADAEALRTRILEKQDATRERHAEHLAAIRSRALQQNRQQTISESQDTKPEDDEVLEEPESKEKQKARRKRLRKIKQKLIIAGEQYESSLPTQPVTPAMTKNKMCRALHQLHSILAPVAVDTPARNGSQEATPEPDGERKRRKKKRKTSVDSSKQSVCSSVSDLSRCGNDADLNLNQLDRSLNELHRIVDKIEQNGPERTLFRQVHGWRPLSRILSLASEKDHNYNEDSLVTKSLVTCLQTLHTVLDAGGVQCRLLAADLLMSNTSVHTAILLLQALENFEDDSPIASCLADLLAMLFESVKTRSRTATEEGSTAEEVAAMRQRAFLLISYLSAGGACGGSHQLYRLLTAAVQLCEPTHLDPPSSCDRQSAWSSLSSAIKPGLCGAREHLTGLSVSPTLPPVDELYRLTTFLRAVAERDKTLLQESFSVDGGALELSAAVYRLLATHAPPVGKETPRSRNNKSQQQEAHAARLAESVVLDLIVIVGFFVIDNPHNQEAIIGGISPPMSGGVLRTLSALPAGWLCREPHSGVLLPTLAALADNERARRALETDISLQMVEEYISSEEAKNIKLVQLIRNVRAKRKVPS